MASIYKNAQYRMRTATGWKLVRLSPAHGQATLILHNDVLPFYKSHSLSITTTRALIRDIATWEDAR